MYVAVGLTPLEFSRGMDVESLVDDITLSEDTEAWKVLLATPADADGDFGTDVMLLLQTQRQRFPLL